VKKLLPEFIADRLDPNQRYGLRLTLLALAIALVAVPFGLLLEAVVHKDKELQEIDTALSEQLFGWVSKKEVVVAVLKFLSFLGKPLWFWIVVGAAGIYLFKVGRIRLLAFLLIATVGGGVVDTIVKVAVNRSRPELEDPLIEAFGKSFPSGHAMTSIITYGALLLIFMPAIPKRWRVPAVGMGVTLVASIGFSRLALGVHYLSDILAGYALGLAWLVASTAAFSIWQQEKGRKPVEPLKGVEPAAARDLKLR
jgi:membrane-associated phospholipid phosphatase